MQPLANSPAAVQRAEQQEVIVPLQPVVAAPWLRQQDEAIAVLADYLGLRLDGAQAVCEKALAAGWRCETLQAISWDDILEIDRPTVLSLLTPARFTASAVLVGISGEMGTLLHREEQVQLSLTELGSLWQGEHLILWRPPASYTVPFGLGDNGPVVAWLAQEFAGLDGQSQPLAGEQFNAPLDARVRMFQREYNLRDDGVVGLKTLLKLNVARGHEVAGLASSVLASLEQ